jgi:hypothetical protein
VTSAVSRAISPGSALVSEVCLETLDVYSSSSQSTTGPNLRRQRGRLDKADLDARLSVEAQEAQEVCRAIPFQLRAIGILDHQVARPVISFSICDQSGYQEVSNVVFGRTCSF